MNKKIDRALHGPGMMEVIIGAILALLLGVLAAGLMLVARPITQVKEMPKQDELVAGVVYFVPGAENAAKGRTSSEKLRQFVAGNNIVLGEEELNAFAAGLSSAAANSAAKSAVKPPKATPAAAPAAVPPPQRLLTVSAPNFRLRDGSMQIAFKCKLSLLGVSHEVAMIATGNFVKGVNGFEFSPAKLTLGSCPVHLIPLAAPQLLRRIAATQPMSPELQAAWSRLADVRVDGAILQLATQ